MKTTIKATLLTEVAGRRAGATANVNHEGDQTYLLEDAGGQFSAPKSSVTLGGDTAEQKDPAAKVAQAFEIKPFRHIREVAKGGTDNEPWLFLLTDEKGVSTKVCLEEIQRAYEVKHFDIEGFSVPDALIQIRAYQKSQEPKATPKPVELVERYEVDEATEKSARLMYDLYNEAVGGVAWNGDALPAADEFFEDPAKQKQANAWRKVAEGAVSILHEAGVLTTDEPATDTAVDDLPDTMEDEDKDTDIGGPPATNPEDPKSSIEDVKDSEEAGQEGTTGDAPADQASDGGTGAGTPDTEGTSGTTPNNGVDEKDEEL